MCPPMGGIKQNHVLRTWFVYLVFEHQGLCGNGACATRAKKFRESDDQVNGEDEQIAHGANATTASMESKTAQHAPVALNSHITISPPRRCRW